MKDWEALEQELLNGSNADALRSLASTQEAQALGRRFSAQAAESALRSGDAAQVERLLRQVLSTPEGAALFSRLRELDGGT